MRLMYDSVRPGEIPADAEVVALYVDGKYAATAADWNRFTRAVKVRISAIGENTNAHVFDCEPGCIWPPAEVVPCVLAARARGIDPTVYVNERNHWGPVRAAFDAAGVAHPHWLVANYNGVFDSEKGEWVSGLVIPAGAVGKQFADPGMPGVGGHYDLSVVADYWPGVDGTFDNPSKTGQEGDWLMSLTQDEQNEIRDKVRMIYTAIWGPSKDAPIVGGGPGVAETIQDTVQRVAGRQGAQIEADRIDDKTFAAIETIVNRIDARGASGGMTPADRAAFLGDLADAIPSSDITVQTLVNAFQQLGWTVSARQIPTGG